MIEKASRDVVTITCQINDERSKREVCELSISSHYEELKRKVINELTPKLSAEFELQLNNIIIRRNK